MLESLEQLASKHPGEYAYRHEKGWTSCDPLIASDVEATTRDDAVNVWMKGQGLGPGVKHCDCARGRSQPALAHGMECFEDSLEEEGVAATLLSQKERMQGRRHREHQVEVGHREKAAGLSFHPSCLLQALALGTMPIPAGVVEGLLPPAVVTHLHMTAQKRGSTLHNVSDHPATVAPELLGRRSMRPENLR
jgi:hypothetical protein